MFDFTKLKGYISNLGIETRKLAAALESKKLEREKLQDLPLPRDDFIKMITSWVDESSGRFNDFLHNKLIVRMKILERPNTIWNTSGFGLFTGNDGTLNQECLCAIFGKEIKSVIAASISTWDWPAECGLPRAERKTALVIINKEIEKLEADIHDIQEQAHTAGITLAGGG